MALIDKVKARYGDQYLVNISNPYGSLATTTDDTRIGLACDDVEADFETYVGVEFDLTDARHVAVVVSGVEAKLLVYCGHEPASRYDDFLREKLENGLALVTSRDRQLPETSSVLVPSEEQGGRTDPKPYFDEQRFAHLIPGAPSAGEDDSLD